MFDLALLSAVTEKLKRLKIVKTVQKMFPFVQLPVEMGKSIQEKLVIMGHRMGKMGNVQFLVLLLILKNRTVGMGRLIQEKTVLLVLKI
jgi:hypothetical protein